MLGVRFLNLALRLLYGVGFACVFRLSAKLQGLGLERRIYVLGLDSWSFLGLFKGVLRF